MLTPGDRRLLADIALAGRLSERDFQVAVLLRDGYTQRQAAAIIGTSRGPVCKSVRRIKRQLRPLR